VHLYDLAWFLIGDFAEIMCDLKTFDKGVDRIGEFPLDANDSAVAAVRFANGAIGTLHTTRWATGQRNTVGIRAHGTEAALDLDLDRPEGEQLRLFRKSDGEWENVECPPTPNMYERFATALRTGEQGQTSFEGGARIQAYLDAAMASAETGRFVPVQ